MNCGTTGRNRKWIPGLRVLDLLTIRFRFLYSVQTCFLYEKNSFWITYIAVTKTLSKDQEDSVKFQFQRSCHITSTVTPTPENFQNMEDR